MWLRDSAFQVLPYLNFTRDDPALAQLICNLARRQAYSIVHVRVTFRLGCCWSMGVCGGGLIMVMMIGSGLFLCRRPTTMTTTTNQNKQVTPYANAFNYNACTYLRARPQNFNAVPSCLPASIKLTT